jgi:hypothetical protein
MAEAKTKPTSVDVQDFLAGIPREQLRADCQALARLMSEVTGQPAVMWGPSMVGFGHYHYTYESGRQGDMFITGFAPRQQQMSLYLNCNLAEQADLLSRLGTYKTGKGCLYVKRLADVDQSVLRELIKAGIASIHSRYPTV